METLKIKLGQIFEVDAEINGISSTNELGEQVTLIRGFINESLSLTTKYWLLELNKEVNKVKSSLESLRDELIKKYGVEDKETGKIIISLYLHIVFNVFISLFSPYLTEFHVDVL